MTTLTFKQLVDNFEKEPNSQFRAKQSSGLSYVSSLSETFVEPAFRVVKPIEAGKTSIVLLSAAGAVGKSTLASAIAQRASAPLWDLSTSQVGSKTLEGTLLAGFGDKATGVMKRLREGEFLLVLDALDEAQIRAGSQNFDTFLSDLSEISRAPRSRPTLVLLARTDTADWIDMVLEENQVPFARYQIDFFDAAQSFDFIAKQLDVRRRHDKKQPLHRQQAASFSAARNALFGLIYKLFDVSEAQAWGEQRVRDFLGYAPVLEALTDYLDVPNYMSFIQELQSAPTAGKDPWQFLTEVLERLLDREQKKMVDAVRGKLEASAKVAGWNGWDGLYLPNEQLTRVLAHSLQTSTGLTSSLPQPLDGSYEEAVRSNMPQHPFLSGKRFANVVFKEYTYAWGLTKGSEKLSATLREAMRQTDEPFLPTQIFSRFVLTPTGGDAPVVDGQDFGLLYESLLSRGEKVQLSVTQHGETARATVALDADNPSSLDVDIFNGGSGIHLWRRLSNADVDTPSSIRLGLPGQRFLLGPSVHLTCGELAVACDDLDIDAADGVFLKATSYASSAATLRLRVRNEGTKLSASWPGLAHPWAVHRREESAATRHFSESRRGDTLRKFILMFRRQKSRLVETLEGARWAPDQAADRDRLIGLALTNGVLLRIEGPARYVFNTDFASLSHLLVGDVAGLSPKVRAFVEAYLEGEEARKVFGT